MKKYVMGVLLLAVIFIKGYTQSTAESLSAKKLAVNAQPGQTHTNEKPAAGFSAKFDGKNKTVQMPENGATQTDSVKRSASFKPAKDSYMAK